MPAPKPAFRPRISGGFNDFGSEDLSGQHSQANAQKQALQNMQQTQQLTNAAQSTTGGSALGSNEQSGLGNQPAAQKKPRPLGTLKEELVDYPLQALQDAFFGFFDLNNLLGIKEQDDPQKQAKKKQMLQRWQKLNEDQQAVARERYQKRMQEEQRAKEEEHYKKQQEEQMKGSELPMPTSTKKGAVGPGGSKKNKSVQKLQMDRKTLGGPKGSN